MKLSNSAFTIFALCLTTGLLGVYAYFVDHFSKGSVQKSEMVLLQRELEQERLKVSLLEYQLQDLHQSVGFLLPAQDKIKDYKLANIGAAVRGPASVNGSVGIDLSGALFERAKDYFNDKNYGQAVATFKKILSQYPLSIHTVEAQFFIAESYFLTQDYQSSLAVINTMVQHYPHHELTGFILLRLGQINQINNQTESAKEVYSTVLRSFENKGLKKQAQALLTSAEGS